MPIYAGLDMGGTQLKFGLLDEEGRILFKDKASTPSSIAGLFGLIRQVWEDLKKIKNQNIAAAGLGFPGIFSAKDQKILQSPNYPELDGFDLRLPLDHLFDIPYWIDNDANLAAYGEWTCGAGKGVQSLILLTLGTGVGSGLILGGDLWHGACGFAGEMGHIIVNPDGERCCCGAQGCLETEAAAGPIVRNYNSLRSADEDITSEEVFQRAKKGDEAARKSFERAGYYLGIGLGIAINLLNPEKILLGGGVMESGDLLMPRAIEEAQQRSYKASFSCCSIERASLGNDAGLIGAASWARDQFRGKKT